MDLAEYSRLDGVALGERVRRGAVSPKDLVRLFSEAVDRVNPKLNAILEVYQDRIEGPRNEVVPPGPFAGVPFLMKDVGAGEAGRRQESGSRLMKGHVVEKDAWLTARFKQAGLVLLGRTATPEFALGVSTESALVGDTHNPWNPKAMAGGSSGGSAACVAAGIVPAAHGSDSGGSIRIPASACGVVGLKPSRGRVTLGPDIGELFFGMLQEFVVSRTVRDSAVMLDTVSAPGPGDPFVIPQPARPYAQEVDAPATPLRIAWTADHWQPGSSVDPEVVDAVHQAASACERAGHKLVEASPVFDYEAYLHAACDLWAFGMYAGMEMAAAMTGREISESTVEPVLLSYYEYSKRLTAADSFNAESVLNTVRRSFGEFFQRYDMLLTPTLTRPPEPLGRYTKMRTDIDYIGYMRLCDEGRVHTPLANVTGQPAISLPLAHSRSGLPIGIQFMGRFGEEGALLRLAGALEKAMPWRERLPPVHAGR